MDLETLQTFFGYSMLVGYAVLLLWAAIFRLAHDWHFGIAKSFFNNLQVETYNTVNLAGLAAFKIAVILFYLIPFLTLWLVTR